MNLSPRTPATKRDQPATTRDQLRERLVQAAHNSVVIDVETTGLDPTAERIIEIAAVHAVEGEVRSSFHTVVNPGRPLAPFITEFTGLTDATLSSAEPCPHALDGLMAFLASAARESNASAPVIVGHNVAFDASFIEAELLRDERQEAAQQWQHNTWLCTAEASRALIARKHVGRYRLGNVAEFLNTPHRPSHRALDDVYATYEVLLALNDLV